MSKVKKVLLIIVTASCCLGLINLSEINAEATEKTASQSYVEAMEPGWNLGNTFESVDTNLNVQDLGEQSWGNPTPTKELIDAVKASGFKSIRMPFTAYKRFGAAPDYTINKEYLDKYAKVVKYALDQELYVIADMQHVDVSIWAHNIGSDDGTALNTFKALWKQFAEYFKDYPEQLSFEPTNEPAFTGEKSQQIKINNEVNNAFRDIVRSSGGNNKTRMLIFPNLGTTADEAETTGNAQNIAALNDSNIIATFHYYSFWPFSVNIAGHPKFDAETRKDADKAVDYMYNNFTAKGVGVLGGEFSVLGEGVINNGEYLKYMDYMTAYARQKGITMMLWDAGYHMDRKNYTWKDPDVINTIIAAANGQRSSYTDCDTLYVNGKTRKVGVSTNVTLSGNRLVSIIDKNNNVLLNGVDYTFNNGVLTFNSSYLKPITKSYGTSTRLTLKFSKGADWKMNINYYKMPVSSDAEGSSSGLTIPMQFNGVKLATMEAIKSGTENSGWPQGVGPADWTTYKGFKDHFEPDYTNNIVVIKDVFFKECIDGDIILKFHFEDGAVTTYKLNKSGNSVKGIAVNTEDTTLGDPDDDILIGDVNNDGVINVSDYSLLRKYINMGCTGIKINKDNSDINGDGQVDFFDLVGLKAMI